MCHRGAILARHDGGVTWLKKAASCERIIRSAYPRRSSASTVRTRCSSASTCSMPNRSMPMVEPFVHQRPQVVEVLRVSRVADDHPLERHAARPEEALLVEAVAAWRDSSAS